MISNGDLSRARPNFNSRHSPFRRPQHRFVALVCAFAVGHPASAMAAAASAQEVVTYADLDVSAPSGTRELSERILHAAKRVCARSDFGSGVDQMALRKACVADTYHDAVSRFASSRPSSAFVLQVRRARPGVSLSAAHY